MNIPQVLYKIITSALQDHPNCSNNLLYWRGAKSSNGIRLLAEVIIMRLHCIHYPQKERLGHPKPPSEMSLTVYALVRKVVLVDAIVTSRNVPWHFAATRQRSTKLFLALVPPGALKKTINDEEVIIIRFILLVDGVFFQT